MSKFGFGLLNGSGHARSLRRWARALRLADTCDLSTLRRDRSQARALRPLLDRLIRVADDRLTQPLSAAQAIDRPHNADWAWRPGLWSGPLPEAGLSPAVAKAKLGDEITLFHDCDLSDLTLRQIRTRRQEDTAPFGLSIEVLDFGGSFLSLVIDLPADAVAGLLRSHILRLVATIEMETPLEVFARLNIRNGPNTEQIVQEVQAGDRKTAVEFDLAYSGLNEKRIEAVWIDLIFEKPRMNRVVLRDLTLTRRPRAQL